MKETKRMQCLSNSTHLWSRKPCWSRASTITVWTCGAIFTRCTISSLFSRVSYWSPGTSWSWGTLNGCTKKKQKTKNNNFEAPKSY